MEKDSHKYEYQVDLNGDTAPARVVRMVGRNKKVLELGAGPGSITRLLKEAGNCRVTALEIDREAITKLTPHCERVYLADLNDVSWPEILSHEERFEVLVAADVLEHVYDPKKVLKAMTGFLSEDGYLVISLPHIGHSVLHACLFNEDFEYRDWGLLDRTHIRFFGIKNIQKLFESSELKIVDAEFVTLKPEETEFGEQWKKISPGLRLELSKNPFGLVYQIVIKAVPVNACGDALSLMSLTVPPPIDSLKAKLITYLSRKLSPKNRTRLRQVATKIGVTGN